MGFPMCPFGDVLCGGSAPPRIPLSTDSLVGRRQPENVHFTWLSAKDRPDFHTIDRFGREVMKGIVGAVFALLLELLIEEGYAKLGNCLLDGTKIEAGSNNGRWVWAKNTQRYWGQLQKKMIADAGYGKTGGMDTASFRFLAPVPGSNYGISPP